MAAPIQEMRKKLAEEMKQLKKENEADQKLADKAMKTVKSLESTGKSLAKDMKKESD